MHTEFQAELISLQCNGAYNHILRSDKVRRISRHNNNNIEINTNIGALEIRASTSGPSFADGSPPLFVRDRVTGGGVGVWLSPFGPFMTCVISWRGLVAPPKGRPKIHTYTKRCSFQLKLTREAVKLPQLVFLFTQSMICWSTVLINKACLFHNYVRNVML